MPSSITCTRRLHFSAGHRVYRHEGQCARLHGHNYVVYLEARAADLDSIGRVIDFSVLKEKVGGWIDAHWDHKFLVYQDDYDAIQAVHQVNGAEGTVVVPFNPTAENMAAYLLQTVCPGVLKGTGATVSSVIVQETENCSAEAVL